MNCGLRLEPKPRRKEAILTQEIPQQVVSCGPEVTGNGPENSAEGSDPKATVRRNRHMVALVPLTGKSEMGSGLTGDPISVAFQRPCEIGPR